MAATVGIAPSRTASRSRMSGLLKDHPRRSPLCGRAGVWWVKSARRGAACVNYIRRNSRIVRDGWRIFWIFTNAAHNRIRFLTSSSDRQALGRSASEICVPCEEGLEVIAHPVNHRAIHFQRVRLGPVIFTRLLTNSSLGLTKGVARLRRRGENRSVNTQTRPQRSQLRPRETQRRDVCPQLIAPNGDTFAPTGKPPSQPAGRRLGG